MKLKHITTFLLLVMVGLTPTPVSAQTGFAYSDAPQRSNSQPTIPHPSLDITQDRRLSLPSTATSTKAVPENMPADIFEMLDVSSILRGNRLKNFVTLRNTLLIDPTPDVPVEEISEYDSDAISDAGSQPTEGIAPTLLEKYALVADEEHSSLRNHPLLGLEEDQFETLMAEARGIVVEADRLNRERLSSTSATTPVVDAGDLTALNRRVAQFMWKLNEYAGMGFPRNRQNVAITMKAGWYPTDLGASPWYAHVVVDQNLKQGFRTRLTPSYTLTFNYGVAIDFDQPERQDAPLDENTIDARAEQLIVGAHASLVYLASQHAVHIHILRTLFLDLTEALNSDPSQANKHKVDALRGASLLARRLYSSLDFLAAVQLVSHLGVARYVNLVGMPATSDEGQLSLETVMNLAQVSAQTALERAREHSVDADLYDSRAQSYRDLITIASANNELLLDHQNWGEGVDNSNRDPNKHTVVVLLREGDLQFVTATARLLEMFNADDLVTQRALEIAKR